MYSRGFALTVNFANRFYLRIRNLRDHLPAAYNMLYTELLAACLLLMLVFFLST